MTLAEGGFGLTGGILFLPGKQVVDAGAVPKRKEDLEAVRFASGVGQNLEIDPAIGGGFFEGDFVVNEGNFLRAEPVQVAETFLERVPVVAEVVGEGHGVREEGEEFRFARQMGGQDNAPLPGLGRRWRYVVKGGHGKGMKVR